LAVGARHLGAVCHVPWAILLNDRRELVVHVYILPPGPGSKLAGARREIQAMKDNWRQEHARK
jgi:hypothetical protein